MQLTTADWALLISICSFAVSLAAFVWNVWSKFIYPKAKVRTLARVVFLVPRSENQNNFIDLTATNFGPTEITLHASIARSTPWFWFLLLRPNRKVAFLNPLDNYKATTTSGPFSGGLPKKLAVGEAFSAYFPISATDN